MSITGATWAPVPQRNTSSATQSSVRSIDRLEPKFLPDQVHDALTRDSLEDVVRWRRRVQGALADDEDVLGAALADMPVHGQEDGLVEARLEGLRLGQGAVHVYAGALGPGRHHGVVHPPPRAHQTADSSGADVGAHRSGADREALRDVVELHADDLRRLEDERSDVDVLTVLVAPEQLPGDVAQFGRGERHLHLQDAGVD